MTTRRSRPIQSDWNKASHLVTGYRFRDHTLLSRALTHRSLAYEAAPESAPDTAQDNEQLEFVGDAVLGLAVAEDLFRRFPASREGDLTRMRASLVGRRHLAEIAAGMRLGDGLLLGRGEEQSGGREKPALLADALEAVIAAIYLDGGIEAARRFVETKIVEPALPHLQSAMASSGTFSGAMGDHKSALQEHLQASGAGRPRYILTAQTGPDHRKSFRVEVQLEDSAGSLTRLAESEGGTKKQAQQDAARIALELLSGGAPQGSGEGASS